MAGLDQYAEITAEGSIGLLSAFMSYTIDVRMLLTRKRASIRGCRVSGVGVSGWGVELNDGEARACAASRRIES